VSGPPTPACPFCGARATEQIAPFGSQLLFSQWRCRQCRSYFEAVRETFTAPPRTSPPATDDGDARNGGVSSG